MSDPLIDGLAKLLRDPLSGVTPARLARMTLRQLKAIYGDKGEQPTMAFRRDDPNEFKWDVPPNPSPNAGATVDGRLIDEEPLLWNLVRAGVLKEERVRAVIAEGREFWAKKEKGAAHASQ